MAARKPGATKNPGLRAWRSMPKASRQAINKGGTMSREQKADVGKSVRQQRRARGANPNTGAPVKAPTSAPDPMKYRNYQSKGTTKTAPVSGTRGGGKQQAEMVAKGRPYKGQSSKKAVRNTALKVMKRQAEKQGTTLNAQKQGAAADRNLKQARRIVRARKASRK